MCLCLSVILFHIATIPPFHLSINYIIHKYSPHTYLHGFYFLQPQKHFTCSADFSEMSCFSGKSIHKYKTSAIFALQSIYIIEIIYVKYPTTNPQAKNNNNLP